MSGEERRKIGHRWYRRISASEAQRGDLIQIYDRGYRWRRVGSRTKRGWIRVKPLRYRGVVVYKARSYNPKKVVAAWTKRKE